MRQDGRELSLRTLTSITQSTWFVTGKHGNGPEAVFASRAIALAGLDLAHRHVRWCRFRLGP